VSGEERSEKMVTLDKDTLAKLALPFDPNDVEWKPQAIKGNKALAVAYIDARTVAERLDQVTEGDWAFDWESVADGAVKGRLTICGVIRCDVGEPGDGPQGETLKAAVSDALKRSAVLFGVGRYLYRLPAQWVDYDAQYKRLARRPELPAWAKPGTARESRPPPPSMDAEESEAEQGEPTTTMPHWIENEQVRKRFWAWTTKMALNSNEVHEALEVEHIGNYDGSMLKAKDQIIAYVNSKAADPAT